MFKSDSPEPHTIIIFGDRVCLVVFFVEVYFVILRKDLTVWPWPVLNLKE